MDLFGLDISLIDFSKFSDHSTSYQSSSPSNSSVTTTCVDNGKDLIANRKNSPKHRHDGSSPFPLGMDWSVPQRKLDNLGL